MEAAHTGRHEPWRCGFRFRPRGRDGRGQSQHAEFGVSAPSSRLGPRDPCGIGGAACRLRHARTKGNGPQASVKRIFFRERLWREGEPLRRRAAARRAQPGRQAVPGTRQVVLSQGIQDLLEGRHRVLVRRRLPRPAHRERRGLQRLGLDGGPSHHAAAELRPRHQSRQRLLGGRAGERSRTVP